MRRLVKLITTLKVTIKITTIPQIFSLGKGQRRKTNSYVEVQLLLQQSNLAMELSNICSWKSSRGLQLGGMCLLCCQLAIMLWLFALSLTFCIIRQNIPLFVVLLTAIIQDQVSSSIVNLMLMLFFNLH